MSVTEIAVTVVQVILLFLGATVVFDTIHYILHQFAVSRWTVLRAIGDLHETHHRFLDRNLELHEEYRKANLRRHVIPEFFTHISVSLCFLLILPPRVVYPTMVLQTLVFLLILRCKGEDINHREVPIVRAYRPTYVCMPQYHFLHHAYPDAHYSSWIKLFDHVVGAGMSLTGKRVLITGATGAFGSALRSSLQKSKVKEIKSFEYGTDFDSEDLSTLESVLSETDILVLCHGSTGDDAMTASCDSYVRLIECFQQATRERKLPVEVWALGSELELRRARRSDELSYARAKQAFVRHARQLYTGKHVIYRHPVAPVYRPSDEPSPSSMRLAARAALFFIRCGFNYVPATLTGLAALNLIKFRFFVRPTETA